MLNYGMTVLLALSTIVLANPLQRRQSVVRAPNPYFNLYLSSNNATLNGSYLATGHAGAGIEQLVVANKILPGFNASAFQFQFNQSISNTIYDNITGNAGEVVWNLRGANFNVSQALGFYYNPFFDTAVLEFGSTVNPFTFHFKNDTLIAAQYTSNATNPVVIFDNFYSCKTPSAQTQGYTYTAIHWRSGSGNSTNTSCQKVSVKRKFV